MMIAVKWYHWVFATSSAFRTWICSFPIFSFLSFSITGLSLLRKCIHHNHITPFFQYKYKQFCENLIRSDFYNKSGDQLISEKAACKSILNSQYSILLPWIHIVSDFHTRNLQVSNNNTKQEKQRWFLILESNLNLGVFACEGSDNVGTEQYRNKKK